MRYFACYSFRNAVEYLRVNGRRRASVSDPTPYLTNQYRTREIVKKTLFTLVCSAAMVAPMFADEGDYELVGVYDGETYTLNDVTYTSDQWKADLSYISPYSMVFKDVQLNITDADIPVDFYMLEFLGHNTMHIQTSETINFETPAVQIGGMYDDGVVGELIIDISADVVNNALVEAGDGLYTHSLMTLSYFDTGHFQTDEDHRGLVFAIEGVEQGSSISGYTLMGLVDSADDLKDKEIGFVYQKGATEGWEEGDGTWEGSSLYMVAKGAKPVIVPEPATATLSLLALAGLCARRRRTAC